MAEENAVAQEKKPTRLGRGLSALLGEEPPQEAKSSEPSSSQKLPIAFIEANPLQPRRTFRAEDLEDLVKSVRENGILQPILVRPHPREQGRYQIVAGERRWRAAQKAQLHEIPVVVKTLNDVETLEIALVENIQRADLDPIEEAKGYETLIENFGHTQEQLSKTIGKSRSHIANTLRLLSLPDAVQGHLKEGALTPGHARALITSDAPLELAQQIIEGNLSVRDTEALAKSKKEGATKQPQNAKAPVHKDADTRALEDNVSRSLGLKVLIDDHGDKGGVLKISYKTLEQLDDVCRRLAAGSDGL